MSDNSFRDNQLGPFSSHPYWRGVRSIWLRWAALIPFIITVALLVIALTDVASLAGFFQDIPFWQILIGSALAFSLGFFLTASLADRWASIQEQKFREDSDFVQLLRQGRFPVDPRVLVISVLFAVFGPWVLAFFDLLPSYLHLMPELLAFFPIVAFIFALRYLESDRQFGKWRALLSVALFLGIGLFLLSLAYDLVETYKGWPIRQYLDTYFSWYGALESPFLGAILLLPVVFLIYWIRRFWTVAGRDKDDGEEEPHAEKGWLGRLGGYLRSVFGQGREEGTHEVEHETAEHPPAWLTRFCDEMRRESKWQDAGSPVPCSDPLRLWAKDNFSPIVSASELRHYFGDQDPTLVQQAFLQRFNQAYREILQVENGPVRSANMLIEGKAGSGRTTALLAASLFAILVRGQRVLYLVPDRLTAGHLLQRARNLLALRQVERFCTVDILSSGRVSDWLEGNRALPNLLFATPEAVESALYGYRLQVQGQQGDLRALILSLEVILVDDFMIFNPSQRSHLPFILDKHALLLASRYLPMQAVVSMPPLAEVARDIVGSRLYTQKGFDRKNNFFAFKPRPVPKGWGVEFWSDRPGDTVIKLAVACVKSGRSVLLSQAGLDPEQEHQLEERVGQDSNGAVKVVSGLNQRVEEPEGGFDVVIYQAKGGEELNLAHQIAFGHEDTVVVNVLPQGERRESGNYRIVPVMVNRTAQPIFLAHLYSVARFLEPGTPIPADFWNRFGLRYDDPNIPLMTGRTVRGELFLGIDSVPRGLLNEFPNVLWPYLMVEPAHIVSGVNLYGLPNLHRRLFRDVRGDLVVAGSDSQDIQESRRAYWRFQDGAQDRQFDLAYLRPLLLTHGTSWFVPGDIRQDERTGQITIHASHWKGGGNDSYLPVVDVRWTLPNEMKAFAAMRGGPVFGYQQFRLAKDDDAKSSSDDDFSIEILLQGLMDEFGSGSNFEPKRIQVDCQISGILLAPTQLNPETMQKGIACMLAGDWETHSHALPLNEGGYEFWPGLTAAVSYAFRRRLPGLNDLAQTLAFGLNEEAQGTGKAVIWIIEPGSTGDTARKTIETVFGDDQERKVFFKSVYWLLEQLRDIQQSKPGGAQSLIRRFCRIGYDGDHALEPLDQALELASEVIRLTDPAERTSGVPLPYQEPDPEDPRKIESKSV